MRVAGIIVEYNPAHTGHMYQIARTRAALGAETGVLCCMSGNWVQSGARAVADKWARARLAVSAGADLVVELPTLWAASSAETFARGGVSLLVSSGVVTDLSFGSECGDAERLAEAADCLDSPAYATGLRRFLDEGLPFAVCRQAAVTELLGREAGALLSGPNNNLGIEYLRAMRRLNSAISPLTILRRGAGHGASPDAGGAAPAPDFLSSTQLRHMLERGEGAAAAPYLAPGGAALSAGGGAGDASAAMERMALARLRTMTAADWAALPDSAAAEGLPDRLARAGREARSLEEFYELAKTKRYTHARLRRLALWAFLGLRESDRPERPPYLRVLACDGRGREMLRAMRTAAALPVLTKPARVRELDGTCRRVFELESRCTDLYDLCLPEIPPGGREWREGPAVL